MNKYLSLLSLTLLFSVSSLFSQTMADLAGRWSDTQSNFYVLEVLGEEVKWKNEKSQVWTTLIHGSGFDYTDDDGYRYSFSPYKGTVAIVNPDNERDIKSAKKMDFVKPGGKTPRTNTSSAASGALTDYRGAHGFLLTYQGSIKAPVGFAIGGIGKSMGMFFGFRTTSFSRPGDELKYFDSNNKKEFGGGDVNYVYVYNGYSTNTRGAMTLGYVYPFKEFLSFYLELGYGWSRTIDVYDVYDPSTQQIVTPDVYNDNDNLSDQLYAVNRDTEIHGLETGFGVMGHYKIFNATFGLSMVNAKSPDLVLGIGFLFH